MVAIPKNIFDQLPLADEKTCQAEIEFRLVAQGIPHEREYRLSDKSIIDFLVHGSVGLEVKMRKSGQARVIPQLLRYCSFEKIRSIVLVTNSAICLPRTLHGKPVQKVSMGSSWL